MIPFTNIQHVSFFIRYIIKKATPYILSLLTFFFFKKKFQPEVIGKITLRKTIIILVK